MGHGGVKYYGCAPLYGGLTNAYSPVYWCSTKVDINSFHIRGPWSQPGKYVGYCDDTCPRANLSSEHRTCSEKIERIWIHACLYYCIKLYLLFQIEMIVDCKVSA